MAAVAMAARIYEDLGDQVCDHGIYRRCCKACWIARYGPWEFHRESSVVKQERLPLLGVKHLWRSNGFRRKQARQAYHVSKTGFYSSALPISSCSSIPETLPINLGSFVVPGKKRRWDAVWKGAPHRQDYKESFWCYLHLKDGVVIRVNGGPLFSLVPTVRYEKKFVTPRKDYWRPSIPITGEVTARTLADSRRRYVVNFEDFAAEFNISPKNEDWRRVIRAVTRGCVCRACLMARFPELFRLWTPASDPPATDYRKFRQEPYTSVRDTPAAEGYYKRAGDERLHDRQRLHDRRLRTSTGAGHAGSRG